MRRFRRLMWLFHRGRRSVSKLQPTAAMPGDFVTASSAAKARFRRLAWLLAAAAISFWPSATHADEDEDELPKYRSGLVAVYLQADRTPVERIDDDLQFVWRDDVPDARLTAGAFSADWRGRLFVLAPGAYRLHVFVAGQVTLKLNGATVLTVEAAAPGWHETAPITLPYGHHPLEVSYSRTGDDGQFKLHWSGPQFGVEPIPERHFFHEPTQSPTSRFDDGALLVRALRCAACHSLPEQPKPLPAPALTHLRGNVRPQWLIEHLLGENQANDKSGAAGTATRRMPHLPLKRDDAEAITAYLLETSADSAKVKLPEPIDPPPPVEKIDPSSKKKPKPRTAPSRTIGEQLTRSLGCLGCHRVGELGTAGLFAGTDLSEVAQKRTPDFFVRWFESAATVNVDHRMPQFKLESLEKADLAAYFMQLGEKPNDAQEPVATEIKSSRALLERGRELVSEHRCGACHRLPGKPEVPALAKALAPKISADDGCLGSPDERKERPGYRLSDGEQAAISEYLSTVSRTPTGDRAADEGRFVLVERNCLGCHSRGLTNGLADRVPAVTAAAPELAAVQAALLPPSLNGVGDKLTDAALIAAIKTERPPLRPWLRVRMPKFDLSETETTAIPTYLIDHDRIPDRPLPQVAESDDVAQRLAARRLVTADGFGCTSCHKIGKAEPSGTIAISAMGTDLSQVGDRLRKPWFDRWVRNPARIIPRMEMPAVQLAVRGVLHDDVNEQLSAVWKVLNEPGFTPPLPNPVRIVRSRNVPGLKESPHVLTDVFQIEDDAFVSSVVIGLPNRHNVLFDLEKNQLAAWWTGDTALERTKGKSWYWEPGGSMIYAKPSKYPSVNDEAGRGRIHWDGEVALGRPGTGTVAGQSVKGLGFERPWTDGQNVVVLDELNRDTATVTIAYRLTFRGKAAEKSESPDASESAPFDNFTFKAEKVTLGVRQTFEPLSQGATTTGLRRTWEFTGVPADGELQISPATGEQATPKTLQTGIWESRPGRPRYELIEGGELHHGEITPSNIVAKPKEGRVKIVVDYLVDLPIDTFPNELPAFPAPPPQKLDVSPGYDGVRLPLPAGEMPTGFAWSADGTLLFASLKGRVFAARDTNGDGLEDALTTLSDDLATPYGLAAATQDDREVIDVITKPALVRLHDDDRDGFYERQEIAADGWGHTDDYHDWAVGLPKIRDAEGRDAGYYVALPCQQDDRDEAKARLRGQGLRLTPREPTKDDPRRFTVEPFCGGLRFPMGLAVNRAGQLFASDNQGNYNPFNELNHLQTDKRYGFINKRDRQPDFAPPTESPAVEIPHPWTRSVNGLCFLETPEALRKQTGRDHFGAFEGHLLGCEYNERALIRMSLETVDGVIQGAAYPFTLPVVENAPALEGPNVAAVAPDGDLYVGSLRDSGWGGGQNTGSIVRLTPRGELPLGLAEVRALPDGFELRFTAEVDQVAASQAKNYSLVRYRRESTPQYGGDDQDRAPVRVNAIETTADGRTVRLRCEPHRAGFVYEFHLQGLTPSEAMLFPAEAHYTMKRVPK